MNKNLRKHHRLIKTIIAVILVVFGYIYSLWWIYVIALIFLVMAIFDICPADCMNKKKSKK